MRDLYAYLLFKLEESHIRRIIISFATPEAILEMFIIEIDFLGESCYNINMCKNKALFYDFSLQIKTYFCKWKQYFTKNNKKSISIPHVYTQSIFINKIKKVK